jgi:hypothetical protein
MDLLEHLTKANVGTGESGNYSQQHATRVRYRFYVEHILTRASVLLIDCAIDPEPIFVCGQRADEAPKSKHDIRFYRRAKH